MKKLYNVFECDAEEAWYMGYTHTVLYAEKGKTFETMGYLAKSPSGNLMLCTSKGNKTLRYSSKIKIMLTDAEVSQYNKDWGLKDENI